MKTAASEVRAGCRRRCWSAGWGTNTFCASRKPPKSAGREEFGAAFLDTRCPPGATADLIRTAEELTAVSIARSYRDHLPGWPERVVVTGGGARNPVIMASLRGHLSGCEVMTGEEAGIDGDYKEAVAFAVLGLWRILGKDGNVPAATGASRAVVLGKISHP